MAKRFVFRFETMLKLRRQHEDERKRIVADRLRQIHEEREQRDSLERQIHDELAAVRASQEPGRIDMEQIVRHRHWLGRLRRAVLESEARMKTLQTHLAGERMALAEAVKQRRILEKLKEHRQERFRAEQDRLETLAADDLSAVRYVFETGSAAG